MIQLVAVSRLEPSRYQPRHEVDRASLEGLAASIRANGVMQPVLARPSQSGSGVSFELVAGERRWRAARLAGLSEVPAIITDLTDRQAAEWGVVENVQREDLDPIARAFAFKRLKEEFGLTHTAIAERIGLDRSSVTNLVRLCELEPDLRSMVSDGRLSAGHGKALLSAPAGEARREIAERAARERWSVRQVERAATRTARGGSTEPGRARGVERGPTPDREALERQLSEHLGTRVRVRVGGSGRRGSVSIDFYDLDHLDGLLSKLGFVMKS